MQSGQEWSCSSPLLYHRDDGGDLLLVATNGGADWDPQWLRNLTAHPEAEVDIDGERLHVTATRLGAEDRDAMWDVAARVFPTLGRAQAGTPRPIPLVRLRVRS